MKKLAAILFFSFYLLSPAMGIEQTHEEFTGKVALDVNYRYLLALPDGYKSDSGRKWPLIVFLHGAGERGTDLETVKKHGPPKLIAAGQKFEAIVASLQCLAQQIWNPHGVKALTDELIKTLRVDTNRVYLTGLSMGGFATWETALEYPGTYAAIVPICGGAGVRFVMAERIKHLPVWIFHGARDPVVEPSYSKKMFDALTKVGGNVKLTMYPDALHDSWTAAYNDPELWKWMFAQKRGGS
jgi:predicted peptidase